MYAVNQVEPIIVRHQGDALRTETTNISYDGASSHYYCLVVGLEAIIMSLGRVEDHYYILLWGQRPLLCPMVALEANSVSYGEAKGHLYLLAGP